MRVTVLILAMLALVMPTSLASPPPSPEFVVSYQSSSDDVFLSWSPVERADRYTVYAGNAPNDLRKLADTTGLIYQDFDADAQWAYYAVTATVDGLESPPHTVANGPPGQRDCVSVSGTHVVVTVHYCVH